MYRLKVITCLVFVWILNGENIFDCMMRVLLALTYPVCCMVVLYVTILSCDDHQFNWWEQMGEVPAVNKGMTIPQLSHLGWTLYFFSSWFSLGLWPMYCFTSCYSFLFARLVFWVPLTSWCAQVVGIVLRILGFRYNTFLLCDVYFNFA